MAEQEGHRRELARRLRCEGKSRAEIQRAVGGMSNERLSEWLRDLPEPGWTARPRAKDEVRAECVRLRLEGLTYDLIAAQTGVSKAVAEPVAARPARSRAQPGADPRARRTMQEALRRRRCRAWAAQA